MKKGILFFLIGCLIVLFIGCAPRDERQQTGIDISELETQPVGEKVETGDIVWEITNVENLGEQIVSDAGIYTLEAEEGQFINIDFTIQNNSEEIERIFDLTVIDDRGRAFNICVEAYAALFVATEDACTLAEVLPEQERTFTTTFDVATDSKELVLEVTDLRLPPENVKYIDLDI